MEFRSEFGYWLISEHPPAASNNVIVMSVKAINLPMNRVWQEVIHAARQAPAMYFAPFVAAAREVRRVYRTVQRSNRERTANLAR